MRRSANILIRVLLMLLLVGGVAVAVIVNLDWNRARPWIEARASAALDRPVALRGDLSVDWERHGLAFLPSISAHDVHLGVRADGVGTDELASVDGAELRIPLLPLLWHRLDIERIALHEPVLHLERAADGRVNWQLGKDGEPSVWRVKLGQLELDRGRIDYVDATRKANLHIEITPLRESYSLEQAVQEQEADSRKVASARVGNAASARVTASAHERSASPQRPTRQRYAFAFRATGTWQGAPVQASGRLGDVFAARDSATPFPLQARGTVGPTHLAVVGTITDPTSPDAIDLRLWLSGQSMDQLFPILGIVLPATPPYATDGRLTGRFTDGHMELAYRQFSAQLGGSDLAGDVTWRGSEDGVRPRLAGAVRSEHLRFADLATLIGGKAPPLPQQGATAPPNRRLPDTPLHIERWSSMDADVEFKAGQMVSDNGPLPISDIATHVQLDQGALSLKPLRFALAQGKAEGEIAIDGRRSPPPGTVKLRVNDVQLQALLAQVKSLHSTTLGQIDGDIELSGHGDSTAQILGSADGHLAVLLEDGEVSKSFLEIAGLNVLNYVLTKLFGDEPVHIQCAAAAFTAKQGVLSTDVFSIETADASIDVEGTANLGSEKLDLVVRPRARGVRLLSLRTPLYVRGDFSHPDAGVQKGPLLARGAAAAALATAAPVAALAALIAPSHGRERHACKELIEAVHKK